MTSLWWREAITRLLRSPSQTCHAKPKLKSTGAGRYQLLPVGGMPTARSHSKDFSPKSQDAVALQQIKERGALPDWSWWYPSGNRPLQQYLGFTAGRCCGQFEHKADSLIAKFKEAGGTVREIDVWAVTAIISALLLSASSSGSSWAVNCHRDNAITHKAQRDKMPENWKLANAAITTCRCVSVMLLRSMQIHEGVSWC